jgi:uncharacterized protein (DUF1778 family)
VPGGRPPKLSEERADARILFRLREDEKAAYEKAAKVEGKALSEWIREKLTAAARSTLSKRRKS